MSEKQVFLSLGTNLGDRLRNLDLALEALASNQIVIVHKSSVYETEPQDLKDQPWFLNIAVECRTRLFPLQLLTIVKRIEKQLGRKRGPHVIPKGPRLIDIDILLYGRMQIETPQLIVPHPRMLDRRFVLEPLCEIDKTLRHPLKNILLCDQLKRLNTQVVRVHQN